MSEPREWWIAGEENEDYCAAIYTKKPNCESIHVIEYSAYESLKESLILAKKQRDEVEFALKEAIRLISLSRK